MRKDELLNLLYEEVCPICRQPKARLQWTCPKCYDPCKDHPTERALKAQCMVHLDAATEFLALAKTHYRVPA